jgi:hypothetical protein
MKTPFSLGTLTLLALAGAGCGGRGAAGTCATYPACGGDPAGDWTLDIACESLVVKPYQQLSLPEQLRQPQTSTLEPPQTQPTTSGDWCSQLIYQPTDTSAPIKSVVLWHGPLDIRGGALYHNQDHTYTATIIFGGPQHTFFPGACLIAYQSNAAKPTCSQLGADLTEYLTTQPSFAKPGMPGTQGIECVTQSDGCDCAYDYQLISADLGVWELDPTDSTAIIHHSKNGSEPQRSAFCAPSGSNTLQLTGIDGTSMLGQQGLRSLSYVSAAPI